MLLHMRLMRLMRLDRHAILACLGRADRVANLLVLRMRMLRRILHRRLLLPLEAVTPSARLCRQWHVSVDVASQAATVRHWPLQRLALEARLRMLQHRLRLQSMLLQCMLLLYISALLMRLGARHGMAVIVISCRRPPLARRRLQRRRLQQLRGRGRGRGRGGGGGRLGRMRAAYPAMRGCD